MDSTSLNLEYDKICLMSKQGITVVILLSL